MNTVHRQRRRMLVALAWFAPGLGVAARSLVEAPDRTRLRLSAVEETGTQEVASAVLATIYGRLGIHIDVRPMPSRRATQMVRHGETDGEVGRIAAYFDGREDLIRVDPAFYATTTAVFARSTHRIVVAHREDLAGQRVGVVRGILHAQRAVEGLRAVEVVNNYAQLYRMLKAGRLDLVLDTPLNHARLARTIDLADTTQAGVLATTPLHHGLALRHAALAKRMGAEIASLAEAGILDRLVREAEQAYLARWTRPA